MNLTGAKDVGLVEFPLAGDKTFLAPRGMSEFSADAGALVTHRIEARDPERRSEQLWS